MNKKLIVYSLVILKVVIVVGLVFGLGGLCFAYVADKSMLIYFKKGLVIGAYGGLLSALFALSQSDEDEINEFIEKKL
jgi:predicted transporter